MVTASSQPSHSSLRGAKVCARGRGELQQDHIQNRIIKFRNSFWSAEHLSHLKVFPKAKLSVCVCVWGGGLLLNSVHLAKVIPWR